MDSLPSDSVSRPEAKARALTSLAVGLWAPEPPLSCSTLYLRVLLGCSVSMHVLLPLPMQKTTQNTRVPNSSGQRGPCTPAVADLGNDHYELYNRALDSEMRVTTTAFCRRAQEVGFGVPFPADMDSAGLIPETPELGRNGI